MELGVRRGTVRIVPYHEKWKEAFLLEKKLLQSILGPVALAIEHIGSTAIEGLQAKPIIDIAVKVSTIGTIQPLVAKIIAIGYQERVNRLEGPQRVFAKESENVVTHHLHFIQMDCPEWHHKLLFRSYLRTDKEARQEYEALKLNLAKSFSRMRGTYTDMKQEFIESAVEKAKKE